MNQVPGRNNFQSDQVKAGTVLNHMLNTVIEYVEEKDPQIDDEAIRLAESLWSLLERRKSLLERR